MRDKFTNQESFIATESDCAAAWGGGFWCALCGKEFVPGDTVRWVHATHVTRVTESGAEVGLCNFKVCSSCDSADVLDKWKRHNEEFFSAKFKTLRRLYQ